MPSLIPTYMINTDDRRHAAIYPRREGLVPFFDLGTTGEQASQALDLPRGTPCVVARNDEMEKARFDWFTFDHEERHLDDSCVECRVFYGVRMGAPEILFKSQAATSERYKRFFDVLGRFKQTSVVE